MLDAKYLGIVRPVHGQFAVHGLSTADLRELDVVNTTHINNKLK